MNTTIQKSIQRQRGHRDSTDGKPYYCRSCGLGFGEFLACEDVGCELESEAEATKRHEPSATIPPILGYNVGDYSDIMSE